MGLFSSFFGSSTVRSFVSSAVNFVGGVVTQVASEWAVSALDFVREKTADAISYIGGKCKQWGERLVGTLVGTPFIPDYNPEPCDIQAADNCRDLIHDMFPAGIEQTMQCQNPKQRLETFETLANMAADALGLKNSPQITFCDPASEYDMSMCGFYDRTRNELALNTAMIVCDDMSLVKEQVSTVFHEMMHARQWQAVCDCANGQNTFGYSDERLKEYANNYMNYISPEENIEGYYEQPLERDAFGFETLIMNEMDLTNINI